MASLVKGKQYLLHEQPEELQRLAAQHYNIKSCMGGILITAPVIHHLTSQLQRKSSSPSAGPGSSGLRIVDSATADGLWLLDLASSSELPLPATAPAESNHTYIGADITTKYFPPASSLPAHIELHTQDITQPWPEAWLGSFDLVHQRLACLAACKSSNSSDDEASSSSSSSSASPAFAVLAHLVRLLKPGGCIQLCEMSWEPALSSSSSYSSTSEEEPPLQPKPAISPSPSPSAAESLYRTFMSSFFAAMGADAECAGKLRGWLVELGLQDVGESIVSVPVGTAIARDERIPQDVGGEMGAEKSARNLTGLVRALGGSPLAAKTPLTEAQLAALPDELEKDLLERGWHDSMHVVWGRKPRS